MLKKLAVIALVTFTLLLTYELLFAAPMYCIVKWQDCIINCQGFPEFIICYEEGCGIMFECKLKCDYAGFWGCDVWQWPGDWIWCCY